METESLVDTAPITTPVPRPLPAPHHRPPPAEEPDHEHVSRPRLRRGRHAEGAVPALSRGEGQGRTRSVDVRRIVDDLDRLAAAVRADRPRRRPRHPVAAIVLGRTAPPWLRDDDPDHPHGAAHRLELARLAPDHRAVGGARARPSFVPEGHGRRRHRTGHRRLRRRRGSSAAGRARRLRALGARAPRRPVLVARGQPPYRRLRGQSRQPRAVHPGDARGDARAHRRSRPDRHALHHGRAAGGGSARRRRHGDRAPARRRRTCRLPQRHRRDVVRQRGTELHGAEHVTPDRAAHRQGEAHSRRVRPPGVPCEPGGGSRVGESRGEGRMRRHDRHDPRPHRGPASRREAAARRRASRAHLRRRGLLHRPDLRRRGRTLPAERGNGPRADHAARHRAEPTGRDARWWWSGPDRRASKRRG